MTPKYPNVRVALDGEDGNAFAILGRAKHAARRADIPEEEIEAYLDAATSGDYDNLLETTMQWFSTR